MSQRYFFDTDLPSQTRTEPDLWVSVDRGLPTPHRLILYETDKLLYLGYIDQFFQWRRLNGVRESAEVLSWRIAPPTATSETSLHFAPSPASL